MSKGKVWKFSDEESIVAGPASRSKKSFLKCTQNCNLIVDWQLRNWLNNILNLDTPLFTIFSLKNLVCSVSTGECWTTSTKSKECTVNKCYWTSTDSMEMIWNRPLNSRMPLSTWSNLVQRYEKYLEEHGNYVEKWSRFVCLLVLHFIYNQTVSTFCLCLLNRLK